MAPEKAVNRELASTMKKTLALYEGGNAKWFDYLEKNGTFYSVTSVKPYKGREAYRKHFQPLLTATKRKAEVIDQNIHELDGRAIVAQTLQISQSGVIVNVRQTVVWTKTQDGWKMHHLHSAQVGKAAPAKIPSDTGALSLLNEKIATMAAVLGVAQ